MNTLFPIEPVLPAGFSYTPEFISAREEKVLLEFISGLQLHTFLFQGYEAKRRVVSFGYDWSFERRTLSKGKEIPVEFNSILQKVAAFINLPVNDIGELLVTEYPVGSMINWHRDAPPFELIAGISLQSDCKFRFRPYARSNQGQKSIITIPVKRRSLYLMNGESRSNWEHSISPVKEVRYSITLRTLRSNATIA